MPKDLVNISTYRFSINFLNPPPFDCKLDNSIIRQKIHLIAS